MTTFKQFIAEGDDVISLETWLDDKCGPFLDELGDDEDEDIVETAISCLFRGMAVPNTPQIQAELYGKRRDFYVKSVRKDREPRDTHVDISEMVDQLFYEQFGWKPRSQGLFCVGRGGRGITKGYGQTFAVIPMGKFKYLWSPKVFDLTVEIKNQFKHYGLPMLDEEHDYTKEQLQVARPILQKIVQTYKSTDLSDFINAGMNEIMISCDQYAAIKK